MVFLANGHVISVAPLSVEWWQHPIDSKDPWPIWTHFRWCMTIQLTDTSGLNCTFFCSNLRNAVDLNGPSESRLEQKLPPSGSILCHLLRVSSDYAQPITGQVTKLTCPVIGQAEPELTLSKGQKMGPDINNERIHFWMWLHKIYHSFKFSRHPIPHPHELFIGCL